MFHFSVVYCKLIELKTYEIRIITNSQKIVKKYGRIAKKSAKSLVVLSKYSIFAVWYSIRIEFYVYEQGLDYIKSVTNCHRLKLVSTDGKKYNTDVADTEQLAEASTTEISKKVEPKTFGENKDVARRGGNVAKIARTNLEEQLGHSVITSQKASDYLPALQDNTDKNKQ